MQCHYVQVSEFPQSDMNDANNNELHIQSTSSFALGHLQHRRTKKYILEETGGGPQRRIKTKTTEFRARSVEDMGKGKSIQ